MLKDACDSSCEKVLNNYGNKANLHRLEKDNEETKKKLTDQEELLAKQREEHSEELIKLQERQKEQEEKFQEERRNLQDKLIEVASQNQQTAFNPLQAFFDVIKPVVFAIAGAP